MNMQHKILTPVMEVYSSHASITALEDFPQEPHTCIQRLGETLKRKQLIHLRRIALNGPILRLVLGNRRFSIS